MSLTQNHLLSMKPMLDRLVDQHNRPAFIADDPVKVPHGFLLKSDIEIAGFLTAILSWGNRKSILASASQLIERMDHAPARFVWEAGAKDLEKFSGFCHRTFMPEDAVFFIRSLQRLYREFGGLEPAFEKGYKPDCDIWRALDEFRAIFLDLPHPLRTEKHVSNVSKGAAAKRLHMFLRWMVRSDDCGVDFGIWKGISPAHLMIPLDVHCAFAARSMGLLTRKQNDRMAVEELTANLRVLDCADPVRYDFALFAPQSVQTGPVSDVAGIPEVKEKFTFKRFDVYHGRCAMKVGTDGVLLGAWVPADDAARVLDVGTGSGLIALMVAQRSGARIDAIETDEAAAGQAGENFCRSRWFNRLKAIHVSLQQFGVSGSPAYDLIVSNPPFFSRSLKPPENARSMARHTETLSHSQLIHHSSRLLKHGGRLAVILPDEALDPFISLAYLEGLHPERITRVRPVDSRPPTRAMVCFRKGIEPTEIFMRELSIRSGNPPVYSRAYLQLVKPFYLNLQGQGGGSTD